MPEEDEDEDDLETVWRDLRPPPPASSTPKRRSSPVFCEHANEMPQVCPCDDLCYCKDHSCRPRSV